MKRRFPLSPPRRDDGTLLPAVLLAVLLLGGVLQLVWTGEVDLPEAGVGRVAQDAPVIAPVPMSANPVIVAQALFSPTRNASLVPISSGPAADSPLGGATVVGSVAKGRAVRLFLKLPDGTIQSLAPGATYRGWQFAGTSDESAIFVRAGSRMKVDFGSQGPTPVNTKGDGDETEEE